MNQNKQEKDVGYPPTEKSMKYMSWSFKELVEEIKKLNQNLENIQKSLDSKVF